MVGRYVITSASNPIPTPASAKVTSVAPNPFGAAKPSVSSDEPETINARRRLSSSIAQNIAVPPSQTLISHAAGRSNTVSGAQNTSTRSRAT